MCANSLDLNCVKLCKQTIDRNGSALALLFPYCVYLNERWKSQITAHNFSDILTPIQYVKSAKNKLQLTPADSDTGNALIQQNSMKCLLPSVGTVWIGL